jgi:hypothetical protein
VTSPYEAGRYELKYLLPLSRRAEVMALAAPHARPDPHARPIGGDAVGYEVHSLYLDTPQLTDYFDRLERRKLRRHLRVRTYGRPGEGQPVFLETKRKSGRWVVKHRVPVCDAETWCASGDPRPWSALARDVHGPGRYAAMTFLELVEQDGRQPVSVVHYQREVLLPLRDDSRHVRLTLDRCIVAAVCPAAHRLFATGQVDLIPAEWMVMELKFELLAPAWMRELCHALGVRAVPVSKYGLSVARGLRSDRPRELAALLPPPLGRVRRLA